MYHHKILTALVTLLQTVGMCQLHELTQTMRQKDTYFIDCLNSIRTTVPKTGSKDLMLKERELKVLPSDPSYPKEAMHVHAHNNHCDLWNEYMLESIPGDKFVNTANNRKKDNLSNIADVVMPNKPSETGNLRKRFTTNNRKKDNLSNIADVVMPNKPSETGNLRKILEVKIGTRIMITTNIDVGDSLMNGAMGLVTNIVTNQDTSNIEAILVQFDHESIGQDAKRRSMSKHINGNSIPILPLQVSFNVKGRLIQCNKSTISNETCMGCNYT